MLLHLYRHGILVPLRPNSNTVMKFKSLVLLALVFAVIASCKKEDHDSSTTTIKIGGLYSITGNWSSLGIASREAMKLGLIDVNNYLEQCGSSYRFATVTYDTQLDTAFAKASLQTAFNGGVRFIIGPQSSAECAAVRQFANDNHILLVSQGSTASSLAIANDALFRFCPGDGPEGQAISHTMYTSGKRMVITVARNDAGNLGLQNSVNTAFSALGGQVDALTAYAPATTDFTSVIQQLRSKIQQYSTVSGSNQVAVYIASFDECINLFRQAANDTILNSVMWYGGDGMVQSAALLNDTLARKFAVSTGFFAPNFGLPEVAHPSLMAVASAIKYNTGVDPDAYALSVYDAMWVIARTISSYPDVLNDFTKLKSDFVQEANQYFGVTGPVLLNTNGDRSVGSFDYWGIVNTGGNFSWQVVGKSN
jgi:branched-chain amino acid transport system substrate-binding protein